MRILWHFFKRFLRFRTPLLLGLLSIPLAILGDVGVTLLIGDALERARLSDSAEWLPRVMLWLVVYALVQGVFRFYQRWLIVVVSRRVEVQLKQDLFDKLIDLEDVRWTTDVLAEAPLGDLGGPVLEGYTDLLGGVVVSATPR